ncbi:MAG: hypothetical protein QM635_01765 [Microbacteriaceae bacterium]
MKARAEDQALLLELQELDTRLGRIDHRERTLPEAVQAEAARAAFEQARRAAADRAAEVEDVQRELGRVEQDVEVVASRAVRDDERLRATSSVKDVAALEQELAALATRRSDLEDIQLAVMERLEQAEAALAAAEGSREDLAQLAEAAEGERAAALAELARQREQARTDRAAIAARVPAELLALYERQRARYGYGASLLRFGVSGATGVALEGADLARVRAAAADDVILCPASDAILVRTAESGL